jgi:hypothetical protein
MELWILLGLVMVALTIGGVTRLIKSRRRPVEREAGNIYPLW